MTQAHLYDTHCHLDSSRFAGDRDAVITRARAAGVRAMLCCGTDQKGSKNAIALAADNPDVLAAVGVHPHEAHASGLTTQDPAARREAYDALSALAERPQVVAIGEIGLDYHYHFTPHPAQIDALQQQLALAVELDLPVILHMRESESDLRAVLDEAPDKLRGVLHCFLADQAMANWAIARGLYLGFGGAITFRSAKHLYPIIRQTPVDRILIETDAPYMTPHPHRGKRNEPAYVKLVARSVAQACDVETSEIARRTFQNAVRLFGPPRHGT